LENEQTIECTVGKYVIKYKLPEKVSLPYYFVVSTVEKRNYGVQIVRVAPEAIEIHYKKLN